MPQSPDHPPGRAALFALLGDMGPLPPALKSFLDRELVYERFGRMAIMLSPARQADTAWYLDRGLIKEYHYGAAERQVVTGFWKEGEIILPGPLVPGRPPPPHYIEPVEDSSLLAISFQTLRRAYRTWPQAAEIVMQVLEAGRQSSELRAELLTLPAREKYTRFCREFPWRRIAAKDICSYLDMAAQTLSQLRGTVPPPG